MSSSSVLCVDASFLLRALTDPGDAAAQQRWDRLDEYALAALGVQLYGDGALHRQALRLATELDLPTTYDAHCLALAQRFGAPLWTCDAQPHRAVADALPWVELIG